MKFIRSISPIIFMFLLLQSDAWAQDLKRVEGENMVTEHPIYEDDKGDYYSRHIRIKFKQKVTVYDIQHQTEKDFSFLDSSRKDLLIHLKILENKYGIEEIFKVFPDARYGDNMRRHRRTGEMVEISERSQVFFFVFKSPVNINEVVNELEKVPVVEYAEGPDITILLSDHTPNDPELNDVFMWAFDTLQVKKAWKLTRLDQSGRITVAISDFYSTKDDNNPRDFHQDLELRENGGNIVNIQNNSTWPLIPPDNTDWAHHGLGVAGVVGATTDNELNIPGVAWNPDIMTIERNATAIDYAGENGADIINMSFKSCYPWSETRKQALVNTLIQGIIVIAGASNQATCGSYPSLPELIWPAAFDFSKEDTLNFESGYQGLGDGRVITVAASRAINSDGSSMAEEEFVSSFNYSPGENIFDDAFSTADTDSSFIDITAPGFRNMVLHGKFDSTDPYTTDQTRVTSGTSLSAPFVSGIVALILSINDGLTKKEIYDILTKTTDDIAINDMGTVTYIDHPDYPDDSRRWNRFTGFGRVNAFNALIHTIENHGAVLGKDLQQVKLIVERDMQLKYDVDLAANTTLTIESYEGTKTITAESGTVTIGGQWDGPDSRMDGGMNELAFRLEQTGEATSVPKQYRLFQNYPNPFNPETIFQYEIPKESPVRLEIFDITGRLVAVVVDEVQQPGSYQATWDASNIASGIYIYRLRAGGFVQSRRMTLVK